MKKGLIYSLICPLTNEIKYIGQTTQLLQSRLRGHIRDIDKSVNYKNNWLKYIRKNGLLDKLKIEIIEECDYNILNEREIYWINFYKGVGLKLTNSTLGGHGIRGYKHTEISKHLISERSKKPRKKMSDIARKNISKSLIGNKRHFGKLHSIETRKKISNSRKGSIAMNRKTVYQYDKSLNFIAQYDSVKEAQLITNASNISSVCNGKRKYDKNFIWSYDKLD